MQCVCDRTVLARALTRCAQLCRAFPAPASAYVTLTTSRPDAGAPGILAVFLWNAQVGVGALARVPATIREPGTGTVPVRITTDVLTTLPHTHVRLTSVIIPDADQGTENHSPPRLVGGPALLIEATCDPESKLTTRVRLSTATGELAAFSLLSEWETKGVHLATIAPSALRKALEPCLLLAKARDTSEGMDHAQVLLRFDPDELVCTATSWFAVGQTRTPWMRAAEPPPLLRLLVDERMLRWVLTALKKETHPVTLTLLPQEGPTALLLFSLPSGTLVCRGTTAPIPLLWEARMETPASQALLLSRPLVAQALTFLSADRAGQANRYLLLTVVNQRLCLQWDPLTHPEHTAMCQLPLVNPVAADAPALVLLDPLRRMVHQISGPALCLEQGTLMVRQRKGATGEPVPVGFLRLSQPASTSVRLLLTLGERGTPTPPTDASRTSGEKAPEAEAQEATRAGEEAISVPGAMVRLRGCESPVERT